MAVDRDFGKWLKERRLKAGVTASKMQRELDMAWSHYSKIEKGEVGPPRDYDRLKKLAKLLGVSTVEVYRKAGVLPDDWLQLARTELNKQEDRRQAREQRSTEPTSLTDRRRARDVERNGKS